MMTSYTRKALLFVMLALGLVTPVKAHEFWIEPQRWQVPAGEVLRVALRLGTRFDGTQQVYFPARFTRFDLIDPGGETTAFEGRLGDRPAGRITPQKTGLHIIAHETTFSLLRYQAFEKFAAFTREKGFDDAVIRHRQRALPDDGFVERYRRFAKSLVAVGMAKGQVGGHVGGQDMVLGMEVEITALANPYETGGGEIPLRLDRDGNPWGNAQVTVFARPVGGRPDETREAVFRADENGRVVIKTRPGHLYLIDAVSLKETDPGQNPEGAVWTSRWASLTFAVPE